MIGPGNGRIGPCDGGRLAEAESMRAAQQMSMRTLQFLLTEDCNLDCVYCYEKHKNGRALPAAFIQEKIHQAMVARDSYEELSIDFFGGEPLLRFDTIREVVDWFHAQAWPAHAKRYRIAVTTNGTLLNDTRKQWFARNKRDVILCLSLDGTPAAQNANRSNSYDAIAPHLDFFRECWPDQPVKMTIGPRTIDQVFDGIMHLHSRGFKVEADVVFEDVWGEEASLSAAVAVFAQQLDLLVAYYGQHPEAPRPDLVQRPIMNLFEPGPPRSRAFCGAGKHLTCYAANGEPFPCMRFTSVTTSNPLKRIEDSPDQENEECAACVFERLCPSCQGHNYEVAGSCWRRTAFHCRFFKVSLLASARLMLLDEPDLLSASSVEEQTPQQIERLRKLLAIRAVNDWCGLP